MLTAMSETERRKRFRARLAKAAEGMTHEQLANFLGIKRDLVRNWLYRQMPPIEKVRELEPIIRKAL